MTAYRTHLKRWLLSLLLAGGLCATARAGADPSIDSLIRAIPAQMRSDDDAARRLIDLLAQKARAEKHRHGIIQSVFFNAWFNYRHNPPETVIYSIDSALKQIEGIGTDTALVKFYILKGQCYVKQAQFDKALETFSMALAIARKRNDKGSATSTLISIGWAYMEDGKPREAIRFFDEVLSLHPEEKYDYRAVLLCNIAACYNTLGDYRSAETFALKGIATARSRNSQFDLGNGLNILGRSYYQQGRLREAIGMLRTAAVTREKVADPGMLASDYLELADLYNRTGAPQQAIAWARKSEALSNSLGNRLKLKAAYESLSESYEKVGNHPMAVIYLKKLLAQNDSLREEHYGKALAEMQVQFETQKKTAENLRLKKENLEARLRNSNQQRWLLALGGGLLLLAASGVYASKLMKSRYRTRLALEQLSEHRRRTLAVMEAEEAERRRIAGELHDGVTQTLAAAAMQLNKARDGSATLDKVDDLLGQAGSEVRSLSHQVTPELLLHFGLEKALAQAVEKLNDASTHTTFTLFTHIEGPLPGDMLSLALYRSFQELCNNVLKHAGAGAVQIQLSADAEEVQLIVEDDGRGFDPATAAAGLGIRNIRSRIAFFDGDVQFDSTPGKGTTTIIHVKRTAATEGGGAAA
ncbi:MAG: tetratricopeptide repeat protein [Chitinophagaceae bacterium]|nr:MAG: tetratricopeptide repeat protein [Chitinophagaceae bacterium]